LLHPDHTIEYACHGDLAALTNRGFILRELGWLQKALESYEQALAVHPEDAELYERAIALETRSEFCQLAVQPRLGLVP